MQDGAHFTATRLVRAGISKTKSIVTVQRAFKRKFNVDPPTNNSILKWHRNFFERGCICDQRKEHSGRPSVSEQLSTRSRRICCREYGPS